MFRWKNKDQKWSAITIKTIVNNAAYYGARVYNKNSMSKIRAEREGWERRLNVKFPHWRMERDKWVVVEGAHEPIIAKDLWLQANSVRFQERPQQQKTYAPYLLSSLLICMQCGFHFQGQSTTAKGRKYFRYICSGYNNKGICSATRLKRDPVEQFVKSCIEETLNTEVFQHHVEAELRKLANGEASFPMDEERRLREEVDEVEIKLQRITKAIEDGAPISMFKDRIHRLQEERAIGQERLKSIEHRSQQGAEIDQWVDIIKDFAVNFPMAFESAPIFEKKELVRRCISRVEVHHNPRIVRCFVRRIPLIDPVLEEGLKRAEKSKTAFQESETPLSRMLVAGA